MIPNKFFRGFTKYIHFFEMKASRFGYEFKFPLVDEKKNMVHGSFVFHIFIIK